ncbi:hypothetical protein [Odoribacter lunatus]|uniref:hypothetical protein n=1 Tax=Odoribacter lunatus TaxID=2941335 RepID=UPI00203CD3A5|nr:hypothetical protein [Odoribacter lunatus]
MKHTLEFIVAPSDIMTVELDNVVGGACEKVKNKCKDGTVKVKYGNSQEVEAINAVVIW